MAPTLKLLLCAPLLLGASHAAASQRPSLATAAATPAPVLPQRCTSLGCWNKLLFKRESNDAEVFIPPPMINTSMPRVNATDRGWHVSNGITMPPLTQTACPIKPRPISGTSTWDGLCKMPCMRQYMTPVVKLITYYDQRNCTEPNKCKKKAKKCKGTQKAVTYSYGARWGDAYGDRIPQETLFGIAGINYKSASLPEHCNKTKSRKTSTSSKHRRATIIVPVTATVRPTHRARGLDSQHSDGYRSLPLADKYLNQEESHNMPLGAGGHEYGIPSLGKFEPGVSFSPTPVNSAPTVCLSKRRNRGSKSRKNRQPECTDAASCYMRCRKMREKEEIISGIVVWLLLIGLGTVVAVLIGRKVYKKIQDRRSRSRRRREPSGESGNIQEPPTEEVVEVVEVEPRPEERPVREKDVDVPTVIVEEPTPTNPRSVDGASNDEIQRVDRGRLRANRASGSDVYGSEGSARLRHE
ncbi:uncharacterized protein BKA78DRAFT_351907 [Phyllosticta capitalensis]|uniref:uncharacterized protein n=1 Tax=Phyllosticta capitalensis TaxID=121624 RepID=UPI00312DF603